MRPSVFQRLRVPGAVLRDWRNVTALYGAQGVAALAGLCYGKGIATFVDPDQFGTYSVQLALLTLVYSAFVAPLIQSFTASLRQEARAGAVRFHAGLFGRFYAGAGLCVTAAVGVGWLPAVSLLMWVGALAQGLYAISAGYLNASFRHRQYALLQGLHPVLALLLLGTLAVGWPGEQATGLWLVFGIGYGLTGALATYWAHRAGAYRLPGRWTDRPQLPGSWPGYVAYASPLLVYAGFGWVTNYADRYLIAYLLEPADVGFYSTGYGLGARMAIVATPLTALLTPRVLALQRAGEPATAAHPVIRRHLALFASLALPVCALLWAFHDLIGRLLLSDAYRPAFRVVPLIALAYTFSLGLQFLETKFYAFRQTRYILIHSVVGALTNVLLNLWLIPRHGLVGAAGAMLGSCGCQFAVAAFLFGYRPNRVSKSTLIFERANP